MGSWWQIIATVAQGSRGRLHVIWGRGVRPVVQQVQSSYYGNAIVRGLPDRCIVVGKKLHSAYCCNRKRFCFSIIYPRREVREQQDLRCR